jgi:hypothetical protein
LCSGSELCEHNIIKYNCVNCKGTGVCEHNKSKTFCKHCNGTSFCEHGKRKSRCIECGGNDICNHNITKRCCKECNPSYFCSHGKPKTRCKTCGGSEVCIHDKLRYCCLECGYNGRYCINCKLVYKSKKYDNHCLNCFIHLFPDQPVCRNYKTKESATALFIKNNFPNFTWNLDKKIEDGCSKRRPDLMCDLGYQVIIIEIDENQHTDYDCSCENKRVMQLSQDVGHRPIIFIRFNPDEYIISNNEKITSCWGITPKTGILKIKNNKADEWNNRLYALKSQIEYWTDENNKTEKTIEIVQLFYDEL